MSKAAKKRVPAIRFKGFEGEWEERLIDDVCGSTSGGGTPRTTESHLWEGTIPWIQSSDVFEEVYCVKPRKYINKKAFSESAARLISENSIAIVTRVGVGKLALVNFTYSTSQDFLSLSKLNIDEHFAVRAIAIKLQDKKHETQGTSIKGITKEELLNYAIYVPSEQPEQQKIGAFFKHLDTILSQHQARLEKLQNLKQAMLQKMFPREGGTVPEIRFKGFTGEWEERRLGEMGVVNPKCDLPEVIKYVDLESVVGTQMVSYKTILIKNAPSRAQRLAKKGDLFFQTVRPYQKNNYLFCSGESDFVFSTGYAQIRPYADGHFLLSLVQRNEFVSEVLAYCTGTSYPAIRPNELEKIKIKIPSLPEQQKIGAYFRQLDELIALQRVQVEKLKQIKAAALAGMFV